MQNYVNVKLCKIYAKLYAKLRKIYDIFNAKLFKFSLNSTQNFERSTLKNAKFCTICTQA